MPASEARIEANKRWNKKAYDSFQFRTKKGEMDRVRAAAAACGESLNGFLNKAVFAKVEEVEQLQRLEQD